VYTPNLNEPDLDKSDLDKSDLDKPNLDKSNLDNNFSVETRDKIINKKLLKDISIELGGLKLKSGGPGSYSDNKSLS
jgi:hypothetical protein